MTAVDTLGFPDVRLAHRHAPARSSGTGLQVTASTVTRRATQQHAEPPADPDNWAHVRAAQSGDSHAFGQLYSQYAHLVYRYVLPRVSDHCLAEDITSETFLRALRRIASVSYQGRDVAAWFITIAKNLVLDHIKSSRHRLEVPTADLADTSPVTRSCELGPEQHVLTEITHGELLDCVRRLNPDQRECIRLRFLRGLSVTETAEAMQRNEGAVKALQHRAIRRLAQLLPDDLG
ncbi:RNA polymerase sigma-70 factor (ECF subfamily) [Halopolyspora algeriensis]|uniref:RNA polymerase sigma-70 factor (ECF subfamily) n=1 Tax=Halopolyspora algeriensis TaxID=1500506 RepID=A0A368W2J0_9ACTN|nr:sigma-70 family RNA polymerase sigma factor [Halopolyspora algeriensis]RCW46903.1 RNA polymerase sigma-70 factor (ECF subfamily) [Halopolyspora algeriensis]TQM47994.1 RNA polymerase sigma-70 factor (ECF subfamily) [Halopolyspora algeriensis]